MKSRFNAFLPWVIITLFGTMSFARIQHIQDEQRQQQIELTQHQIAILHQLSVNEELRVQRAEAVAGAVIKQCVEEYRIDGKLSHLAMKLYGVSTLDPKIKDALESFARVISQNQGELQCANPLPKKLRQKLTLPSSIKPMSQSLHSSLRSSHSSVSMLSIKTKHA